MTQLVAGSLAVAGSLGSPLQAERRAAGLSQEELAELSGMSARNISNIERGFVTRPRRSSLNALADALDLAAERRRAFVEHYRQFRDGVNAAHTA